MCHLILAEIQVQLVVKKLIYFLFGVYSWEKLIRGQFLSGL